MEITYLIFEGGNPLLSDYLPWWIKNSQTEKHMVHLNEQFEKDLLYAVIAICNEKPIAAAAIVNARTKKGKPIKFRKKLVVELGSNFVTYQYRGNGIGKKLVEERLKICEKLSWFAVSITTNPAVHSIFKFFNGKVMKSKIFTKLREKLCICECRTGCNFCPLDKGTAWYFPENPNRLTSS